MKSLIKEHSSIIHNRMVKVFQTISFVFQMDILKPNYKINAMVYFDFLLIFHYFISTVYIVISKWDDKSAVLRAMCLEGINIQLFVKLLTIAYYSKEFYALNQEILAVHNQSKGAEQDIMYIWSERIQTVAKVQFILYFTNAFSFCLYPFYGYLILKEKILIYDLLLPFDATTTNGYAITIGIQIFLTYGTTVGIFIVDLLFMLMIFAGAAYIDLLDCDCKMLSNEIENLQNKTNLMKSTKDNEIRIGKSGEISSNLKLHNLLVTTIRRSQRVYQYFVKVYEIFERGCLMQVYSCALTILLCVFVAKTSDWFVVYLIAGSYAYQLSVYCIVGSLIEYKSEEIEKSVYNIPWYNLTIEDQKMVKLLLQYVQNTITFSMLGGRKLNVQTGCDVYKTIYSTYVMLEQFY